jgi:uncharacterized protein YndB with AHSA1/START domain
MGKPPLTFTFYIAARIEKVWNGFVSKETNQTIFMGADFEVDLRPGGAMTWSGPGKDGQRMRYVTGQVLAVDVPARLEYKFGMGDGAVMSRVTAADSFAVEDSTGDGENISAALIAAPDSSFPIFVQDGRQRLDNEISSTMARGGSVVTSQTSAAMSSGWIMAARASAEGG